MASIRPHKPRKYLFRNPISYLGGLLAGMGTLLVLLAMLMELSIKSPGPYFGIFTYIVFPGLIIFGGAVVLFGMWRESKRRRRAGTPEARPYPAIDLNDPIHRRRFAIAGTAFSLLFVFLTFAVYNGIQVTESVPFCGSTCHTPMMPEATAYEHSPHARVACVECHVGSGAGWYVHAKVNGMRQLFGVMFNTYDRPIPTPIKGLRPARETCETCHWPKKHWGSQLYQRPLFLYDEKNTPEQISMLIKTGGGEGAYGAGIHWHMAIGNKVTYVAEDDHLQEIPWVKVTRTDGSSVEYFRTEKRVDPETLATLKKHDMDCMDCHNRPAHDFDTPDIAVDRALAASVISPTLPWVKTLAVETLSKDYPTREAAHDGMRKAVMDFYAQKYPDVSVARVVEIGKLADALGTIYDGSVFPEMKVSWKTYPSNLGHRNSAGCFRCHDNKHVSADGKVLISECKACHTTPQRGPQSGMGESMTTTEKDWHPWQTPEKHLAVEKHKEILCHECHLAGRKPKTECNECHSH
ncbi:MAG: NapC/NirT family cytochrome c [Polyangiaceae bacterium]|jgi:hypothetical protein